MVITPWATPADSVHATAKAAIAAVITDLIDGKIESLFPSTRNLLESSSVAQRLDGYGRLTGSLRFPVD
jgi:hypothetical protein